MKTSRYRGSAHAQRGATLFVGLIILALLTLHAIAALHTGTTQLRIVGNVHERRAAESAAETAIGALVATVAFPLDPAGTAVGSQPVDVDGDGRADFDVALTAQCRAARSLSSAALDPLLDEDAGCLGSSTLGAGSLCAQTQWDVQAVSISAGASAKTGVRSEVHQGIAIRMSAGAAAASC
jgi:hypothetical protein